MTDYFIMQEQLEGPTYIYKFLNQVIMNEQSFHILEMSRGFDISDKKAERICSILVNLGALIDKKDREYKFPNPESLDN